MMLFQGKYRKEIDTPLGKMIAGADESGICFLQFADHTVLEISSEEHLSENELSESYFKILAKELSEYFRGSLQKFSVPLSVQGTDFQKKVWQKLLEIPYASTKTYREQAAEIGNPRAVRAAANANGKNKIIILIPCHRIVGSSGKLTGYNGGIDRKMKLLELEKRASKKLLQ
ncbi:methylated-DNA--[protein]-cysteine S-methyltransferase [Weeksellaceae bacterium A-14]